MNTTLPPGKTNATNRRIREIISSVDETTLIPRPDFQRRLVWTNADKIKFIDTILKNLPFPEIYVCAGDVDVETAKGTEWLVDGQQRVSTIFSYFKGDDGIRVRDPIPAYSKLSKEEKKRFLEYTVVVRDLGELAIDQVREVFERINSTKYGLNAMELSNARYDGAIKKFADGLAQKDFFSKYHVFGASDIRRMQDLSFCLSVVITMHSGYFDDTSAHERYLEEYNDDFEFEEEYEERLDQVLSFLDALKLSAASRWMKKAEAFTLIVEVDRAINVEGLSVDKKVFADSLKTLEKDIQNIKDGKSRLSPNARRFKDAHAFSHAASQGSNHRKNRVQRGLIIEELLGASIRRPKKKKAKKAKKAKKGRRRGKK